MARRTFSSETKEGILNGLRNGENKAALASRFGVSVVTIYNYAKTLNTETTTTADVTVTPAAGNVSVATPVATRKASKRSVR